MIDNSSFKMKDSNAIAHLFDRNFFVTEPERFQEVAPGKYRLYNDWDYADRHYLMIEVNPTIRQVKISGSLRKWHLGALSLDDLTQIETWDAFADLAVYLGMSYRDLAQFHISRLEVGFNLDLGGLACSDALQSIEEFKNSRFRPGQEEGYRRFRTKEFTAKCYDKVQEIESRFGRILDPNEQYFYQNYHDKNIMRIEFVVRRGRASVREKIGIDTIGGLADNYFQILMFCLRNARKFAVSENAAEFRARNGSYKDFMDYLKYLGLQTMSPTEQQEHISRLNLNARRDVRKALKQIRAYSSPGHDAQAEFRKLVTLQLISLLRMSDRQIVSRT